MIAKKENLLTPHWQQDIFNKAWDFATLAHQGQTYGGPKEGQRIDYINHLGSVVMEIIWALGCNASYNANLAIQCALLHDVIEDTDYSFEDVKAQFGNDVATGVMALSKNETLSSKREQILDSLARIKTQPREVWMVKLADRITNLSPPPAYWTNPKRIAYREEAMLIYDALHPSNELLAQRLNAKIDAYQQYISGGKS